MTNSEKSHPTFHWEVHHGFSDISCKLVWWIIFSNLKPLVHRTWFLRCVRSDKIILIIVILLISFFILFLFIGWRRSWWLELFLDQKNSYLYRISNCMRFGSNTMLNIPPWRAPYRNVPIFIRCLLWVLRKNCVPGTCGVSSPASWNGLLVDLRDPPLILSFRKKLKSYLFTNTNWLFLVFRHFL